MEKTVMITGANRGIGLEFVQQYFEDGWEIYATARQPEEAQKLHELQSKDPDRLKILKLDISNPEAVEAMGRTLERVTSSLDLLINNAGTYGSKAPFGELTAAEIREVFETNCLGSFRVTRRVLDLIKAGEGKIVFITSLMGSIDDNRSGGAYPYRISKAALNMLGKTISEDYKNQGIYSLLLHPGWVKTRMGGENAKITTEKSVSGMRDVIEKLDEEMSGEFYAYDGEKRPW